MPSMRLESTSSFLTSPKSQKSSKISGLDDQRFTFPDLVSAGSGKPASPTNGIANGTGHLRRHMPGVGALMANQYNYIVKIILLGDQGVGKTSFLKALQVHPDVTKAPCRCSMGPSLDHLEMELNTCHGKSMMVRLYDTGGQERYRSLTSSYYRGAHGVILMFDTNNAKSLDNIEMWLSDLDTFASTSNCTRVLLGSNCASAKRTVTPQEARTYAESRTLPYMEVDSSQFYNIVESIQLVANRVANTVDIPPPSTSVIKPSIGKDSMPVKKRFTCIC